MCFKTCESQRRHPSVVCPSGGPPSIAQYHAGANLAREALLALRAVAPYYICESGAADGVLRPSGCAAYLTKAVRTGVAARRVFKLS